MERVRCVKLPGLDVLFLKIVGETIDRIVWSGNDRNGSAVHNRQIQIVAFFKKRPDVAIMMHHGQHRSGWHGLHQLAAFGNDRQRVVYGHHASDRGRSVFADTVTNHCGR